MKRIGLFATLAALSLAIATPATAADHYDTVNAKEAGKFALDGYTVIDSVDTTVTNAQLLALNGTPITVLAAPGAGLANVFRGAILFFDHTTTACGGIAAGENLAFKYTDGSGVQISHDVETTGFLDQSSDQLRWVGPMGTGTLPVSDIVPAVNAAIVIQLLTGEIATCSGEALKVRVFYQTIPSTL